MPQVFEARVSAEVSVNAVPVHVELRRRAHAGIYFCFGAGKESEHTGKGATGVEVKRGRR